MRLSGKSIIVTGATGIAAAGARMMAEEGASVFVISLEQADSEALVESVTSDGGNVGFAVADLTVEKETRDAFEAAESFLGGVDGLYAVAGASGRPFGDGPADEMTLEAWERTLQANTHPMFLATSNAIARMRRRGGSVVIVSSVLATRPVPELFATHAYAAAKGAAYAFVTSLAAYYAPDRIRVNGIAPGLVRTPMSRRAASDPDAVAFAGRKQPLAGGFLEPEQIAGAAVFLLSDDAAQVTGQVIAVDGGWSVAST